MLPLVCTDERAAPESSHRFPSRVPSFGLFFSLSVDAHLVLCFLSPSQIESLDYLWRAELCILSSSGIICSHGLSFIARRQTNEDEWKAGKQRVRHYQVRRIERCSWENVIPIIPGTWVLAIGVYSSSVSTLKMQRQLANKWLHWEMVK